MVPSLRDAGQQAGYSHAYRDASAAQIEADAVFASVKGTVERHLSLMNKGAQVNVRNWLKKLSEQTANVVWEKNRNAYARLLAEQLRRGTLAEPFTSGVPDGPLPTLPKHLAYAFRPARSCSPAAARGTSNAAAATSQRSPGQDHLEEQAEMALNAAAGRKAGYRGSSEHRFLPMQQPGKLEQQSGQGNSWQRQPELEWRLQQMEGLLHQHSAALHGSQHAAPLGSFLDAMELSQRGSPLRQQGGDGGRELECLIGRQKARRRQRQSPQKARAQALAVSHSDEAEIMEQLDNFQRQTDSIRLVLSGSSGGRGASSLPLTSMAATSSIGSGWGAQQTGTPMRQLHTGLHGSGYTSRALGMGRAGGPQQQHGLRLFEGLPLSPAALASCRWDSERAAARADSNHVDHGSQTRGQGQAQQPISSLAGSAAEQRQFPRSPIGPDIRHTKKSAAGDAERAGRSATTASLQRPKSSRQLAASAAAGTPSSAFKPLSPAASEPRRGEEGQGQVVEEQQQQQPQQVAGPSQATQSLGAGQHVPQQQQGADSISASPDGNKAPLQQPVWLAPPLPPDSNAALAAEVRHLRTKLLASLQKHGPELASGGSPGMSSSSFNSASSLSVSRAKLQQRWQEQGNGEDTWRLAAVPPSSPLAAASAGRVSGGLGRWSGSPWSAPPPATAVGSSSKYRLTDFGSCGRISSDGCNGDLSPLSLRSGFGTPTSLGSQARLSSLDVGRSSLDVGGSLAPATTGFSLEAFQRQTDALRRQLASI